MPFFWQRFSDNAMPGNSLLSGDYHEEDKNMVDHVVNCCPMVQ